MKAIYLYLFLLALFKPPFLNGLPINNQYIPAEYVVIADKITAKVSQKLSERYGMPLIGVGGGLANKVNILALRFRIQGPIEKERLRIILIDCVEEFLTAINGNEPIRPHLKNYPFTPHQIDIAIFVKDGEGRNVYHPYISTASADTDGKLRYVTFEDENSFVPKSELEENYEDALRIVRGQ